MKVAMGRELDPCSKENLGAEDEVTSIKPKYPLLMLLKTWGSSVKTLPSKFILLKSGNGLDRNYHYSIKKDIL
jgi:hypothetical protein